MRNVIYTCFCRKKKKSKKSSKEKDRKEHEGNRNEEEPKAGTSSGSAASDAPYRNKTKTEIAFLKRKEELDKAKLKDRASTTHKEKVEKFNTYLESLSEHYEQAKVSWTK